MTIARWIAHSSLVLICTVALSGDSGAQIFDGDQTQGSGSVKVDPEVKQTGWPSIPLPKITMPTITMPDMSVITTPVKTSYGKVTDGTKKAWEGTKEIFTFGKGTATATAHSQPKEGFWKRMFSSEPEKNDGPQTVGEWMAQPRL